MGATPSGEAWTVAEAVPALAPGEVHVWRAPLGTTAEERERLATVLDAEERRRAARFRFDRHRNSFIVRHAVLRGLLGGYLGRAPETVRYRYLAHGKPELHADMEAEYLRFNMSHSEGLALMAFGRDADLGVDVERLEPRRADRGVARRFFAAGELRTLETLPPGAWLRGFFDCWARKEAFVKAIGEGLSHPLDAFEVSVQPDAPALLSISGETPAPGAWSMFALDPDPAYAAAIVVRGPIERLQCMHVNTTCTFGRDR